MMYDENMKTACLVCVQGLKALLMNCGAEANSELGS